MGHYYLYPKIVADWARLSRWRGWATSKLPFMAAASLLLTPPESSALLPLAIVATVVFWAAFGYGVNDVADRRADQRAGKPNRAADLARANWGVFLFLTASISLGSSLLWAADAAAPALVLIGLVLATAYSVSPLRLKERGAMGLVAAAIAQWFLPVLAISTVRPWGWLRSDAWGLALLALAIGMRWIAIHQLYDVAADRKAGVRTYASGHGRVSHVIRGAFLAEWTLLTATLLLTWPRSIPAVLALAFWVVQQTVFCSPGESLRTRLQGYEQAPLAEYYFLLLPVSLALGRGQSSSAFLVIAAALLLLGCGYIKRMFGLSHRLLRRVSSPWR